MIPHTSNPQQDFEDNLEFTDIVTPFWTEALYEDAEEYFTQHLENY